MNDTIAVNAAPGATGGGAAGAAGPAGTVGAAGPGGRAGVGGLADNGTGAKAGAGVNGASGSAGATAAHGTAGGTGTAGTASGGGLSIAAGTAILDNSTIALNTVGGGVSVHGGTVTATSTLFAGNGTSDYQGSVAATDSLFQTAPTGSITGSGNLIGVNPLLATQGLTNNGGPTDTIALQAGSPALGAGSNPQHVLVDQRGASRTGSGGTDVGAVQSGPATDTQAPTASLLATNVNGANASSLNPYTFTITYTDNVAIEKASLAGAVVQLAPPGGGALIATTVVSTTPQGSTDSAGDAQGFVITYKITPPGGSWSDADNGTYHVILASAPPTDLAGNPVVTGSVGNFTVGIFTGSLTVAPLPSSIVAGVGFGLTFQAEDNGQLISSYDGNVTLSVANGQGPGTLFGTTTVAAVNGVATFTGLSVHQAGAGYMITATATNGPSPVVTNAFSVTAAHATTLVVPTPLPASVTADTDFEVAVIAVDPFGNVDQSFTGPLTIGVSSGPQGAGLVGTTNVNAVGGMATFSNLKLSLAGTPYTLIITSVGLAAATTNPFSVTPAAALEFAVSGETVDENAGHATIEITRASGYQGPVTVDVAMSGGTAVAGVNYTAVNSTIVNFASGQDSASITVPVIDDHVVTPDLTVNLVLSSPGSSATLGAASSNVLTIHNVDVARRHRRRRHHRHHRRPLW